MKDLFSNRSDLYKQARPNYSIEIVHHILKHVPERYLAWDCGAGSGQFTQLLAPYFDRVVATDISASQLGQAPYFENVSYQVQPAEKTTLSAQSVDLISVAQAIHWFNFNAFYAEAKRVLKPHGLLAVLGYGLIQAEDTQLNEAIQTLYFQTLKGYWDTERHYIDEMYQTIPFPFEEIQVKPMYLDYHWSGQQIVNYLQTWSGLKHYIQQTNKQPLQEIMQYIADASAEFFLISFPVLCRLGTLNKRTD